MNGHAKPGPSSAALEAAPSRDDARVYDGRRLATSSNKEAVPVEYVISSDDEIDERQTGPARPAPRSASSVAPPFRYNHLPRHLGIEWPGRVGISQYPGSGVSTSMLPSPYSAIRTGPSAYLTGPAQQPENGGLNPSPVDKALHLLGGIEAIRQALADQKSTSKKPASVIEMRTQSIYDAPSHHPIQGEIHPQAGLLFRVIRRRRVRKKANVPLDPTLSPHDTKGKRKEGSASAEWLWDQVNVEQEHGIFTIEPVGRVSRNIRFRGLADHQFAYPPTTSDPTLLAAQAMRELSVQGIMKFRMPPPSEDFTLSSSTWLPPPLFSRVNVPSIYNFDQAKGLHIKPVVRQGEEYQRLYNLASWSGIALTEVLHSVESVPSQEPPEWSRLCTASDAELAHLARTMYGTRKIWTRPALYNHLPPETARAITNARKCLAGVGYTFAHGPFRDSIIQFGYDPRADVESRLQQVQIRDNETLRAMNKQMEPREIKAIISARRTHLFDGEVLSNKGAASYQLIDVIDPIIKPHIMNQAYVRTQFDFTDGWWKEGFLEVIRIMIRLRTRSLLLKENIDDQAWQVCLDSLIRSAKTTETLSMPNLEHKPKRPRLGTAKIQPKSDEQVPTMSMPIDLSLAKHWRENASSLKNLSPCCHCALTVACLFCRMRNTPCKKANLQLLLASLASLSQRLLCAVGSVAGIPSELGINLLTQPVRRCD
ncbi:uncharacterized protein L969DRAFT_52121 [Mixia osmundae IAM 14324]|uniref:uncharacterized protein n=1 Tax=Mixia osmundae (strain CBS 9802 / IAM 14324 / JCM 22182 / KY 12970) TaxID=764103 RepID=UPI0004A549C4|nr:uncharacterized protein L969DRAFT_52121 [Mixia osmundae IAM 14324]KEI37935.1 hypothetical protein L969DRAFT_52121 [Mixia osmundae IAM 14324]